MLTELEPEAAAATLPLDVLAAHLRLAQGFEGSAEGLAGLAPYAQAAVAGVEAMSGRALISRRFRWAVARWRDAAREAAPVGPVTEVLALRLVAGDGSAETVAPTRYALEAGRDCVTGARGGWLPAIPCGGRAEVEVRAGFGADWLGVPADLRQAVLMLGAHYHEQRHVTADPAREAPMGVRAILARWRQVRL